MLYPLSYRRVRSAKRNLNTPFTNVSRLAAYQITKKSIREQHFLSAYRQTVLQRRKLHRFALGKAIFFLPQCGRYAENGHRDLYFARAFLWSHSC